VQLGLWGTQEGSWTSEGSRPGGRRRRKECSALLHYYTTTDTQPSCFFPFSFLQCVHSTTQPRLQTGLPASHVCRSWPIQSWTSRRRCYKQEETRRRDIPQSPSHPKRDRIWKLFSAYSPLDRAHRLATSSSTLPPLQSSLNLEHHEREQLQLR
jgi:hypothetical protein